MKEVKVLDLLGKLSDYAGHHESCPAKGKWDSLKRNFQYGDCNCGFSDWARKLAEVLLKDEEIISP